MLRTLAWRHHTQLTQRLGSANTVRLQHMSDKPESPDEVNNAALERIRRELEADKKALKWRKQVGERPGDWQSRLRAFGNDEQTSDFIVMMQQPIDLTPSALKRWWHRRKEQQERYMQQYVPDRHRILGSDLAAAHFLLYRGGAVKFLHQQEWLRANEDGEFNLPNKYHGAFNVEALRCDDMLLYYEGLENLRDLNELKFLSYHNVRTFDDWCLDRVSGSKYPKLEVLDISGTRCTVNGLSCLYRLPTLKLLIVNDPKITLEYELACSMLQETIPKLKIMAAAEIHEL